MGPQGLVGAVRVAFNQPMVPLAAVESLRTKPVPLTISPKPAGKARWLGTQVMVWEPEGRMPFSTTYEVTVPAGVEATTGKTLAAPVSWNFSTPTLALESSSPYSGQNHVALEPTITLVFNQPIAKTALVGALELRGKGKLAALTLAAPPATSASTDETVAWREKRTVRVKPNSALSPDTTYTLKLPPGTFGEGPDKSEALVSVFTTYPPLRLSYSGCGAQLCGSSGGIRIDATNRITDAKVDSKVHVMPPVDDMTVTASWNGIQISGKFEGGGRYTVTVDPGVVDAFGQTLVKSFSKTIKLGPPYAELTAMTPGASPRVIERAGSKEISLRVGGLSELQLEARALDTADIGDFMDTRPVSRVLDWPLPGHPATWTDTLDVSASLKRSEVITVDLAKALLPGRHAVWLSVRSEEIDQRGWRRRLGYHGLFEITDLGIAAALDRDRGLIQVTRLSDGSPVANASLSILDRLGSATLWSGATDDNGLATPSVGKSSNPGVIVAETEDDMAFVRIDRGDLLGRWGSSSKPSDQARAFIYTDRTPYKPGDTIHVAGIFRKETHGPTGGVEMWATDFTAAYVLNDPRGIEVAAGDVRVGKFGTFAVDLETDADGGTGNYNLDITLACFFSSDQHFYHSIPVETYRTPEFKVSIERPESSPLIYGDTLTANVIGEYLHGAPLIGAQVAWTLTRSETGFTPPGDANGDFSFGKSRGYGLGGFGGFGR
ncbi:MAG: Ig-like domain-containing protein, partial [Nannocystaceae bacterium]|nr:Ig-like domain-containing protein [Nannocystaceae bacterium]